MAKNFQLTHLIAQNKPSTIVYAAIRLSSRDTVITKVIDTDALDDYQQVLLEISRNKHLKHKNILNLLNCFVNDSQIWLIYPFMYFGSCRDILNSINNMHIYDIYSNGFTNKLNNYEEIYLDRADEQSCLIFNEQTLRHIARSILFAMDYLHAKHIIHRCICPDNIYISQTGQVYLSGLKYSISLIEDGSLAKKLHDYPKNVQDYLNYLSPEILQQNLIGYNTKSDIYSFGVTLCELANGVNPFVGCEKPQMLLEKLAGYDIGLWDRSILNSESKSFLNIPVCKVENPRVIKSVQRRIFSDKFRNFVDLSVQRNFHLRPNAQQLLHHSYLKKSKDQQSCLLNALQTSVVGDGIVETQKRIRLSKERSDYANPPLQQQQSPINGVISSTKQTRATNGRSINNIDDPDYDEVPFESNQNSLWNFDV